jgi:hypothetical protein
VTGKRIILAIVAVLPIVLGVVWFVHGVIGLLGGNGFGFYGAVYGGVAVLVGVGLLFVAKSSK